ncbi:MAG: response regulator [Gammaproteobacteria bacterium]|nr:MAG: response regulator [Gammaproteobacteria bacterium]
MNTKLPCFYYPTIATIIDDDSILLENLIANLSNRISYQEFNNPRKALQFLQNQQNVAPHSKEFLHTLTDSSEDIDIDQHGRYAVTINLNNIYNKLYDRNRFNIPSVIIVDHDMPGMKGIELCRELIDSPIKKIMLTGVTDHKLAIDAFNEGIIHQFILKDDPHVFESIDKAIFAMQNHYFADLSETVIKNITAGTFSYLEEKKFMDFFWQFIKDNSIIEFYLIDSIGSFLLLNAKGELVWLIVKSDREIQNDYQIAVGQDAPKDIIQILSKKQKLLFLFSEDDYKQPPEEWYSYLHQANEIKNIQGCYYSVIQGENAYKIGGICKNKVFSYSNYLNL